MKKSRQIVGVDIENLTRTPSPTKENATKAALGLVEILQLAPGDVVIVSGNPYNRDACEAAAVVLGGSVECQRGPNGADLAINSKVAFACCWNGRTDDTPFDVVTIVSGDGIFAATAAWAKILGLRVRFVAYKETLHRTILDIADQVTFLDMRAPEDAQEREVNHGAL